MGIKTRFVIKCEKSDGTIETVQTFSSSSNAWHMDKALFCAINYMAGYVACAERLGDGMFISRISPKEQATYIFDKNSETRDRIDMARIWVEDIDGYAYTWRGDKMKKNHTQ